MEEQRVNLLKKSKSKFLNHMKACRLERDPYASVEEKIERLIAQAELLANFLLSKYQNIDDANKNAKPRTPNKRSRGKLQSKKKQKKKMLKDSGSPYPLSCYPSMA